MSCGILERAAQACYLGLLPGVAELADALDSKRTSAAFSYMVTDTQANTRFIPQADRESLWPALLCSFFLIVGL